MSREVSPRADSQKIILKWICPDVDRCYYIWYWVTASITRHPQSQFWTACFRDSNGKQRRASTKETGKKKAKRIAEEFEKAVRTKRTLRQVQTVLGKLHEEIAGESVLQESLRQYATAWLAAKAPELAPRTLHAYRWGISQLLCYLGSRADASLTQITKADLIAYRNHFLSQLSSAPGLLIVTSLCSGCFLRRTPRRGPRR